jgi:hypothetical protein
VNALCLRPFNLVSISNRIFFDLDLSIIHARPIEINVVEGGFTVYSSALQLPASQPQLAAQTDPSP